MQRSFHVAGASFVAVALTVSPACHEFSPLMSSTPASAERVLTSAQFGQEVEFRTADTFVLRPPFEATDWQLDFSSDVLQLLTPADRVSAPGAEGWRFRAVSSGTTDLTVTALVSPGPGTDGPAAPRRFSFVVRVR